MVNDDDWWLMTTASIAFLSPRTGLIRSALRATIFDWRFISVSLVRLRWTIHTCQITLWFYVLERVVYAATEECVPYNLDDTEISFIVFFLLRGNKVIPPDCVRPNRLMCAQHFVGEWNQIAVQMGAPKEHRGSWNCLLISPETSFHPKQWPKTCQPTQSSRKSLSSQRYTAIKLNSQRTAHDHSADQAAYGSLNRCCHNNTCVLSVARKIGARKTPINLSLPV